MPKRQNWHIGREMTYPYDAPLPQKQVAYIFDTNNRNKNVSGVFI